MNSNAAVIIEGEERFVKKNDGPAKIPHNYNIDHTNDIDYNARDKDNNILPFMRRDDMESAEHKMLAELDRFKRRLKIDYASFLKANPSYEHAIDTWYLTPDTTLAPVTTGEERQLLNAKNPPEKALALWAKDKLPGDTPPDFIHRHYGQWFDKGFTQADLRRLDPQGEMALRNWRKKNADPEWFHLQTKHKSLAQRYSTPPSPETIENLRAAWRETRRYKRGNRGQTEL